MVYVTGDTHGGVDMHKLSSRELKRSGITLGEGDYLIILGDFGFPFLDSDIDQTHGEYTYWMKWLSEKPYTVLWVDGNHDNHAFWDKQSITMWNGGRVQVHPRAKNVIHLMRGEIYEIEGETYFVFGGAMSHDKQYRVPDKTWWAREECSAFEKKRAEDTLEKHQWNVDYILTHTPSARILYSLGFTDFGETERFLTSVEVKTDFKAWFCGHLHEDAMIPKERISLHYQSVSGVHEREQKMKQAKAELIHKRNQLLREQGFIL